MVFDIPSVATNHSLKYWSVLCFNGADGSLVPINTLTSGAPDVNLCTKYYGIRKYSDH